MFKGIIIEESLENRKILKQFTILLSRTVAVTDKHKTPWLTQWTLHTVAINEEKIDEMAQILSKSFDQNHPNWYIHFWNAKQIYPHTFSNDFRSAAIGMNGNMNRFRKSDKTQEGVRIYVIFKDKVFIFDRHDEKTRESVVKYGVGLGIPKYQLDFPVS